jgi:hypothetical protein
MHLLQNLVLSTKPMISFKWIMMRFRKNDQQDVDNSQTNFSSMNMVQWYLIPYGYCFSKQAPASFNQSLNMFYPKSKVYLGTEMQHQYEDEDPFYNPQLSVNPYQNATSQNPNDPSAVC